MIAERFASVRKQVDGTKALLERLESPERVNKLLNQLIQLRKAKVVTNLETAEDTEAEKTPLKELILEPENSNSKASKQEDEGDKQSQSSEAPQAAAESQWKQAGVVEGTEQTITFDDVSEDDEELDEEDEDDLFANIPKQGDDDNEEDFFNDLPKNDED